MDSDADGEEDLKRSADLQPTDSSTVDPGPDDEGPPMAPKNTTQFLMEDKEEGPDSCTDPTLSREEFLLINYFGEVEQYHRERMQTMSKRELRKEVLDLNRHSAQVEEENLQLREAVEAQGQTLQGFAMRLRDLERDMERLLRHNQVILHSHKSRDKA